MSVTVMLAPLIISVRPLSPKLIDASSPLAIVTELPAATIASTEVTSAPST